MSESLYDYKGKRTPIVFKKRVRILSTGSVGGKKEAEGPLSSFIDETFDDPLLGQKSFEKAESLLCQRALGYALKKGELCQENIDILLAGDLMNQCTSAGYGLSEFDIPYIGLYGACSTFAEGILLGSLLIESGQIHSCAVTVSSHFCSAERQFRFPLSYGSFGSSTAQNTVTGAGAVILCDEEFFGLKGEKGAVYVTEALSGIVCDRGIKDAANMGAAMCTAAADTITRFAKRDVTVFDSFDYLATGDLGWEGTKLLSDILGDFGNPLSDKLTDCGLLIYDIKKQNVGCGGSGCGCSAIVTAGYFFEGLKSGRFSKIGLIGTGAMMSPKSLDQGESIPGIAHFVTLEGYRGKAEK